MGRTREEAGEFNQEGSVVRIPPYSYIHVLDQTSNVTRIEIGPQTFVRKDNERVVMGATKMIVVPPRHYCVIRNPVKRDDEGRICKDVLNQVMLQHAETEIRLEQDPFPLYPGEEVETATKALAVIPALCAIRLKVNRGFFDDVEKIERIAGDEYLFEGPGTYIPRKEVEVVGQVKALIIKPNEALKLRAIRETTDRAGQKRVAGEEWLVRKQGAYLPGAYEEVVQRCNATVLTDKTAVHVRALRSITDQMGKARKNGEEYLITLEDMETHIAEVHEEIVGIVHITTLTSRQYCVILNPVGDDGKPQLGHKRLVKGEKSFFLRPGIFITVNIVSLNHSHFMLFFKARNWRMASRIFSCLGTMKDLFLERPRPTEIPA